MSSQLQRELNKIKNKIKEVLRIEHPYIFDIDLDSNLYFNAVIKNVIDITSLLNDQKVRVLDIGCGKGHIACLLSSLGHDVSAIDIEISRGEQLNIEKPRWQEDLWDKLNGEGYKVNFSFYDGVNIPFPARTFDVVIAYAVIEHVEKNVLDKWLREVRKVLKLQGLFFVFDCPNYYSYSEYLARKIGLPHHDTLYKKDKIVSLLNRVHFNVEKAEYSDPLVRFLPSKLQALINLLSPILVAIEKALVKTPFRYIAHNIKLVATAQGKLDTTAHNKGVKKSFLINFGASHILYLLVASNLFMYKR